MVSVLGYTVSRGNAARIVLRPPGNCATERHNCHRLASDDTAPRSHREECACVSQNSLLSVPAPAVNTSASLVRLGAKATDAAGRGSSRARASRWWRRGDRADGGIQSASRAKSASAFTPPRLGGIKRMPLHSTRTRAVSSAGQPVAILPAVWQNCQVAGGRRGPRSRARADGPRSRARADGPRATQAVCRTSRPSSAMVCSRMMNF
jgi:hypothetical protein